VVALLDTRYPGGASGGPPSTYDPRRWRSSVVHLTSLIAASGCKMADRRISSSKSPSSLRASRRDD
jgi:hypothetical protein